MVALLTMASCSTDEPAVVDEADYRLDLNLADETDWEMANEILDLINDHRMELGLNPLQKDIRHASAIAVEHTQYMIEQRSISHDGFGERAQYLKDRGAGSVGENVAVGYTKAETVVQAWLNSPGHRETIEGHYTHTGFGVMQNAQGIFYYTQMFYSK